MDSQVKVGMVGVGGYGRLLLNVILEEQIQQIARVDVAVVRSPERSKEHLDVLKMHSPGVQVFQTLEEAVRSGVELDLMILPVGIDSHREMTGKALDAGWNVMVEKPLAGSVEEAEAIVRAAEASDRFVAVGYQDMYGPWARAMKAAVLSGAIGDICSVRVLGIWGRSVEYYHRNSWAGKLVVDGRPIYDSPFNNAFAHYLNLALYLAGPDLQSAVTPVAVDGSLWRAHDIESCDTACLNWKTASGPDISVFFSHAAASDIHPELVVQGTKGTLHWTFQSHWEIRAEGAEPVQQNVPAPLDVRRAMIRQLVEKVRHPETPVYTPRQALAQVQASALAQHLPIQPVDRSMVHCSTTTSESGQIRQWRVIEGLEDIGRRFLQGEPVRISAAAAHEAVSV